MGISSDGILVYGVDLGHIEDEGIELPWIKRSENGDVEEDGEDGFDSWLHGLHDGLSTDHLWDPFYEWKQKQPRETEYNQHMKTWEAEHPGWDQELSALHEKQRAVEAACPIELVLHCSYDYAMTIVAVRGTELRAYRGSPKTFEWLELDVIAMDKLPEAQAFCAEHGIPFEDPKWILTSVYG